MKNWKTLLALLPLGTAIIMQWWWFFSVLFVIQIFYALKYGVVEYVEQVYRQENPFVYWLVIAVWLLLAFMSLSYYFQ